jgi:uncharacterized delta-60 repeat protein
MYVQKNSSIRTTIWKALLVTLALSLVTYTVALAAAGDLDTSFSGDGKVTTNIGGALVNDSGRGMTIQSDGKIIVVGDHYNVFDGTGNGDFAVVRYNTNGTLDTTFSGDGKATTNFGAFEQALDVAVQSNGKIVVAGQTCASDACDLVLARYITNGALDTTFSGDGKVTTDYGGGDNGSFGGIAILSSGKIVVAGYMHNGGDYDFAVHRYNSNGTLDTTFSGDGKFNFGFGTGKNDTATDLVVQTDGKIVIAGYTCDASYANCNFAIARVNASGTLDTTFSGDGRQITDFGGSDSGNAVALQPDGKIVVAGSKRTTSDGYFAVARYNTNGNLDTTFSGDGKQTTNLVVGVVDGANDLVIQSGGKIIVVGITGASGSRDFALVRYTSTGALDTTFSGDGKVITDFGNDDYAGAVALQTNGRIVVAGRYYDGSDWDFAVARYLP